MKTEDGCEKFRENLIGIIKGITSNAIEDDKKAAEEHYIKDVKVDLGINFPE